MSVDLSHSERLGLISRLNVLAVAFHNSNSKLEPMTPADLSNDEVASFFKMLQDRDIKYMLVGGFAMAFHGYVRATVDFDIWIKDDRENIDQFKDVLKAFGVEGLDKAKSLEFVAGFSQFNLGQTGFVIDPMKHLKAFGEFDFDACFARSRIGKYNGVELRIIDARDLLKEKKATNLPKDQGDIEYLESLD